MISGGQAGDSRGRFSGQSCRPDGRRLFKGCAASGPRKRREPVPFRHARCGHSAWLVGHLGATMAVISVTEVPSFLSRHCRCRQQKDMIMRV